MMGLCREICAASEWLIEVLFKPLLGNSRQGVAVDSKDGMERLLRPQAATPLAEGPLHGLPAVILISF